MVDSRSTSSLPESISTSLCSWPRKTGAEWAGCTTPTGVGAGPASTRRRVWGLGAAMCWRRVMETGAQWSNPRC